MPSTVVHFAFTGLIGASLLGDAFDRRSLAILLGVTFLPDLDTFVALFSTVGHRAALHNVFVPLIGAVVLTIDLRWRERSVVRERWGAWGVRVAWIGLFVYVVSGIGLDLVDGAANPFWPIHDQYYHLDGKLELSSQRGIVQTFVDVGSGSGDAATRAVGSTKDVELSTGVNPSGDAGTGPVDRVFPIVRAGWEVVLLLVGALVTGARFVVDQSVHDGTTG